MKKNSMAENVLDRISLNEVAKTRDLLLKLQGEGKAVYRLESGDPSFRVPDHVVMAIYEALREGKTHYSELAGIPELRAAISKKLISKNRIADASPDNVFVTVGGMNALYVTFRSLLSGNERVIIPDPMWEDVSEIIKLSGGTPLRVPIDRFNMHNSKRGNIAAIFINSPHNPTGKVFSREELENISSFASRNNAFIVSDEAYEDIIFDGKKHVSVASIYPKTISIFSMSKTYAMSGLRIGYLHVSDELIKERIKKMLRYTINGVPSIIQYGALAALQGPQDMIENMRTEYQKRRDILYAALKNSEYLEPRMPEGAFYIWARIKKLPKNVRNSADFSRYVLEKTGIGTVPGHVFGASGNLYIRFSFSCDTEDITRASELIRNKL